MSNRLPRAAGQVTGVLRMYEEGRHPMDLLDQLAVTRAALDAVALLILDEHAARCTGRAAAEDDLAWVVADLTTTMRRYVRSR